VGLGSKGEKRLHAKGELGQKSTLFADKHTVPVKRVGRRGGPTKEKKALGIKKKRFKFRTCGERRTPKRGRGFKSRFSYFGGAIWSEDLLHKDI